jgi:hypothetical protein
MSLPGKRVVWSSAISSYPWLPRSESHFQVSIVASAVYGKINRRRNFLQEVINENIHSTPSIPNPPTKRATQWDILALDTIKFGAFKKIINTRSRISFYFMCQSKQSFKVTDRPHHQPHLPRQLTMNLSSRYLVASLLKIHS